MHFFTMKTAEKEFIHSLPYLQSRIIYILGFFDISFCNISKSPPLQVKYLFRSVYHYTI